MTQTTQQWVSDDPSSEYPLLGLIQTQVIASQAAAQLLDVGRGVKVPPTDASETVLGGGRDMDRHISAVSLPSPATSAPSALLVRQMSRQQPANQNSGLPVAPETNLALSSRQRGDASTTSSKKRGREDALSSEISTKKGYGNDAEKLSECVEQCRSHNARDRTEMDVTPSTLVKPNGETRSTKERPGEIRSEIRSTRAVEAPFGSNALTTPVPTLDSADKARSGAAGALTDTTTNALNRVVFKPQEKSRTTRIEVVDSEATVGAQARSLMITYVVMLCLPNAKCSSLTLTLTLNPHPCPRRIFNTNDVTVYKDDDLRPD